MKSYDYIDSPYTIYEDGSIIRKYKNHTKVIKPYLGGSGSLYVNLYSKGKRKSFSVPTLIAKLFVPNPNHYKYVNHKDGNKYNNAANNLEWVEYPTHLKFAYCSNKPIEVYVVDTSSYKTLDGFLTSTGKSKIIQMLDNLCCQMIDSCDSSSEMSISASYDIAEAIVNYMGGLYQQTDEDKSLLSYLRGTWIKLSDTQKQEVRYKYESLRKFINKLFGTVIVSNKGTELDSLWQSWSRDYPYIFDSNINEGDMPETLIDIIEYAKLKKLQPDLDALIPELASIVQEICASVQKSCCCRYVYPSLHSASVDLSIPSYKLSYHLSSNTLLHGDKTYKLKYRPDLVRGWIKVE